MFTFKDHTFIRFDVQIIKSFLVSMKVFECFVA